MLKDHPDKRHGLTDYLLGITILILSGGVLLGPVNLLWPERHLPLASSSLTPVTDQTGTWPGSALPFVYQSSPYILVNISGKIYAPSAICTYRESILRWDEERGVLICPAHGCVFDVRGNVLHGLPSRPLTTLDVVLSGGTVYVGDRR
jgi:nitrite reductase/ring-hydroxylating ferredoxin subunit